MTLDELLAVEIRLPVQSTTGNGGHGWTAYGTFAQVLSGSGYELAPEGEIERLRKRIAEVEEDCLNTLTEMAARHATARQYYTSLATAAPAFTVDHGK